MAYDTATAVIAAAAAECGISSVADPYSSTDDTQIQLRNLLNQCGRELYALKEGGWQQFIKSATIATGAVPVSTGLYDVPSDFGFFINQTGWSPISGGTGLPLGGPLTRQQATYLVATGMQTVVTIFFDFHAGQLSFIPAPAPANTTITYDYVSNAWVNVNGLSVTYRTYAANADDLIMFEPVLISTMLAMRYRQAKGIDASVLMQRFQLLYAQFSGVNAPAPILKLARSGAYPLLDPWRNVADTGYGS